MTAPIPVTLPEYASNPFIANLPLVQTTSQIMEMLRNEPIFKQEERDYPPHLRKHCILRLSEYFEPLQRHISFSERFDMLLRQGYLSRNPLSSDYITRLHSSEQRHFSTIPDAVSVKPFESFASGFALLGISEHLHAFCRIILS